MNRRLFTKLLAFLPLGLIAKENTTDNKPKITSKYQKFFRGQRVHILYDYDDVDAIIEGTYRELCGPLHCSIRDGSIYRVIILKEDGTPDYSIAWRNERYMTLVNSNRDEGEQLIQNYLDDYADKRK